MREKIKKKLDDVLEINIGILVAMMCLFCCFWIVGNAMLMTITTLLMLVSGINLIFIERIEKEFMEDKTNDIVRD